MSLRETYRGRLREKYERIKTVCSPDVPVLMWNTYSDVTLESEPSIRRDYNVVQWKYDDPFSREPATLQGLLSRSLHTVVIGAAGSGKSQLLRYLLLDALDDAAWLPVYVPLRRVGQAVDENGGLSAVGLTDSLWSAAVRDGLDMTRDTFGEFARWGQLVLLMDGLDELPPGRAGAVAQAIADLRDRYSDCPMIVSSRPFRAALAWDSFRVLRVRPMRREQTLDMIDRAAPDGAHKEKFTAFLADAGGASMTRLAGNPLLPQLMFMTHDEWKADASPHVFYRQALRALFHDQDDKKPNFRRVTCTGVELDELEAPLEGIAIHLAPAGESSFPSPEVERVLRASDGRGGGRFSGGVDGLIEDLEQTVGVVTQEGGRYEFIHPNLTDYLAARFIVRQEPETIRELVATFAYDLWRPDIVRLVSDIGPVAYERDFLLPELSQILATVDGLGASGRALLRGCALRVVVLEDTRVVVTWGTFARRIAAIGAMHVPRARLIGTGRFGADWISAAPESRNRLGGPRSGGAKRTPHPAPRGRVLRTACL